MLLVDFSKKKKKNQVHLFLPCQADRQTAPPSYFCSRQRQVFAPPPQDKKKESDTSVGFKLIPSKPTAAFYIALTLLKNKM